jgi:formate-dependent nitrite reductase cytochrome c552 subunit
VWAGLVGVALAVSGCGDSGEQADEQDQSLRGLLASDDGTAGHGADSVFPTVINLPSGTPRVATGEFDAFGVPISIACSTCHTLREPNPTNASTADLDEFHQGLSIAHGSGQVSCLSCHNTDDYDSLRLANGTAVNFEDVMTLCSQCHGPQYRDYQHGAHGGMNGYWDLKKGAQTRNNCVDCHDPHAPAYPHMMPTFKPVDRFLNAAHGEEHAHDDNEHNADAHGDEKHED